MRLSVIMAGFARGVPTGFPFFVLRIYTVLPQTEKISRSAIEMSLYIYYSYKHGEAASHFCSLA